DYKFLVSNNGKRPGNKLIYKDNTNTSLENTKINLSSNLIIYIKVFALIYKYKIYKLKLLLVAKFKVVA
ncbi:uncharacterized protein FOBCDRAFT_124998, partial [Fusarium oxysporum Fo47]|uniref:uncharacterized protein n=1 Tax=Fusarium oxysporum Fo47 TaxID=660027 RepID=UPI002869E887